MYHQLIKPAIKDLGTFILDVLFPITCISCDQGEEFICTLCASMLSQVPKQICIVCHKAAPLGITHPGCAAPHTANGIVSIFSYHDERVAKIIITGKYNFIPEVFKAMSLIAGGRLGQTHKDIFQNFSITPIPLTASRRRWRGFNQAEIIAKTLSHCLNLPTASVLDRVKSTKTQKDLKRKERITNMRGAFNLKKDAKVLDKNFILIDDVTTTGSTLSEAVKVLKRNGAAKVWCLTLARD